MMMMMIDDGDDDDDDDDVQQLFMGYRSKTFGKRELCHWLVS